MKVIYFLDKKNSNLYCKIFIESKRSSYLIGKLSPDDWVEEIGRSKHTDLNLKLDYLSFKIEMNYLKSKSLTNLITNEDIQECLVNSLSDKAKIENRKWDGFWFVKYKE